jgi:hypothetical protein
MRLTFEQIEAIWEGMDNEQFVDIETKDNTDIKIARVQVFNGVTNERELEFFIDIDGRGMEEEAYERS